jgi:GNAT superfamily N-acetyltransferase
MLSIRPATVKDVPLLRSMIRELADYEQELDSVEITEDQLAKDGFGEDPKFRALIAEWEGQPAGYAVFFQFYSTWTGRHMFLEDLFVRPQLRGKKIGMSLMAKVASIAREEGCSAMRWEVLAWNQPSIDLYKSLGGEFLEGWKLVLLKDEALKKLAERAA